MDTMKGQGAQAEEITLSALLKMLELSKFLTVETMCEQYLSSHAEEGMAHLVMYAAKVKSATLHKFQQGDSVGGDFQETFPLYIEHRQLLDAFFRHGEQAQVANVLHYMKAYLAEAMKAWKSEQELPSSKEDFCDFAWLILNTMHSYDKSDFAELSFAFCKYLLTKRVFEEAKEFFENAKAQGADKGECLLHILYAAMEITGESEFVTCERLSMNMSEYINLIVAISDNTDLLQKVASLAEENIKVQMADAELREREQQEGEQRQQQVQHRPLNKEKAKKVAIIGGAIFAFVTMVLVLIFTWIIPSVGPQGLIFGISDDGEYAIVSEYKGDANELVIPKKYRGLPVKEIAEKAFSKCTNLTSITIPDSVTSIGSHAFRDCTSLTSITIPDSVTSIGSSAFRGCTSLRKITIPDSVTSIDNSAFCDCTSLRNIMIPDSVLKVDSHAFYGCSNLQNVIFGANSQLSSIGFSAFAYCTDLTSITIPDSLSSVGSYALRDCIGLTSIKYRGTEAQWNAISKSSDWNSNTGNYTITYNCTGK